MADPNETAIWQKRPGRYIKEIQEGTTDRRLAYYPKTMTAQVCEAEGGHFLCLYRYPGIRTGIRN